VAQGCRCRGACAVADRYAADKAHFPDIQEQGRKTFQGYLEQIDRRLAGREWLCDAYSVLDPYAFTFYFWGLRREYPVASLKNYTAHRDRMLQRPAVRRVVEDENLKVQ
jgi:glutathione S-transferase